MKAKASVQAVRLDIKAVKLAGDALGPEGLWFLSKQWTRWPKGKTIEDLKTGQTVIAYVEMTKKKNGDGFLKALYDD